MEAEVDIFAGSGIWLENVCAPRIFVKATCNALKLALSRLDELGCCHALRVKGQGTSPNIQLAVTGYVDDFACHMLGAGVWEFQHWNPLRGGASQNGGG